MWAPGRASWPRRQLRCMRRQAWHRPRQPPAQRRLVEPTPTSTVRCAVSSCCCSFAFASCAALSAAASPLPALPLPAPAAARCCFADASSASRDATAGRRDRGGAALIRWGQLAGELPTGGCLRPGTAGVACGLAHTGRHLCIVPRACSPRRAPRASTAVNASRDRARARARAPRTHPAASARPPPRRPAQRCRAPDPSSARR